ncbi:MAG TPA: sugar ABC transporter permease [Spirochaetia bacterium]|nr:sugar ABC transporter permease [Spirochaetia bacterium]
MRRRFRKRAEGYFYILPAYTLLALVTGYPVIRIIGMSLSSFSFQTANTGWVGLTEFSAVLASRSFWSSASITIEFTVFSLILHAVVAWALALLMYGSRKTHWVTNLFRGLWILPWLFSTAAAALMWGLLYNPFGVLNYTLVNTGILQEPIDFLGRSGTALGALVNVNVWRTYPIYFVLLLGAMQSVPDSLLEAARIEGASYFKELRYVVFPFVWPAVLTMTLLDFITTFGHFDLVKMMTGGGPQGSTQTLAFYIYREAFLSANFSYSAAVSVLMFAFLSIFSVAYLKAYMRSNMT